MGFNPDILLTTREMGASFLIRTSRGSGTCFLFGSDRQYMFVTAAHVLEGVSVGDNVLLCHEGQEKPFPVSGLWRDPAGADAAVFVTPNFPIYGKDLAFRHGGSVKFGEPLKFLGFPHGLSGALSNQGFANPLLRTAFLSGFLDVGGVRLQILDGFNNPGYSGGPVYTADDSGPLIFGIISGYRDELVSHSGIYTKNEEGAEERVPDIYTKPNSGMIISVPIDSVVERILPLMTEFLPWDDRTYHVTPGYLS